MAVLAVPAGLAAGESAPYFLQGRAEPSPASPLDEAVFAKLKELNLKPAKLCSDPVFVRRVYLDVIGTLPTAEEAEAFLTETRGDKRRVLIDQLLGRKEFADYWAMKWSDVLRVKAEFPINLWPNAAQAYHRWIWTQVKENTPYDRFARELLTASGSNFRVPQVNFYRALQSRDPQALGQAVALTFMGCRAEKWPRERLMGLGVFFSELGYKKTAEWKEEIVFFDSLKAAQDATAGKFVASVLPDGTPLELNPARDPRAVFADWLITPSNPWFTRNAANRVWYWLLGRGIVQEPDDFREDNPPANSELLAYLEKELLGAKYDLKHLFRLILNSQTYQLSSVSRNAHPADEVHFARYPLRRLDAEVLIDALCQITGTTEEYSSLIPEPFTFMPEDQRSVALPDGSITSSSLEMFGRPPRDTGLEAERNNKPTSAQRLHLLNSSHVERKIERSPKLQALALSSRDGPRKAIEKLYLTILSRYPTFDELKVVKDYADSTEGKKTIFFDLAWALINSTEFLCRH
jgi:hypothetical protein